MVIRVKINPIEIKQENSLDGTNSTLNTNMERIQDHMISIKYTFIFQKDIL